VGKIILFSLTGFTIFILFCSSLKVQTEYDKKIDFSEFKTYSWLNAEAAQDGDIFATNLIAKKRFQHAIDATLQSKGFKYVEEAEADLLISIYAGIREKINVNQYGYHYGPAWGPYGRSIVVNYYEEGTLFIDIINNSIDELIWRGSGKGLVEQGPDAQMDRQAKEVVEKILEKFPPRTK
jgi:hypothetical protein